MKAATKKNRDSMVNDLFLYLCASEHSCFFSNFSESAETKLKTVTKAKSARRVLISCPQELRDKLFLAFYESPNKFSHHFRESLGIELHGIYTDLSALYCHVNRVSIIEAEAISRDVKRKSEFKQKVQSTKKIYKESIDSFCKIYEEVK